MPEIKPLVSVVLPLFQGEDFLADSFESLLSQSLKDFEVIVLDDCSTDASFEIAERYSSLDKRIKVGRNPRRAGLFANYNLCIAEATGTFLKPMAQDDLLDPNMLEKCVEALSAHERATLVSTGRDYIDVRGEVVDVNGFKVPHSRLFESARVVSGAKVIDECLVPLQNIIGEPSTVLFHRRNALEGFDEHLHHEQPLVLFVRRAAMTPRLKGDASRAGDPQCRQGQGPLQGDLFMIRVLHLEQRRLDDLGHIARAVHRAPPPPLQKLGHQEQGQGQ